MMKTDQPVKSRDDDRLGFSPIADQLAKAIIRQRSPSGFVFGIEGRWGSGKTTLINLTIEALKTFGETAPEIVSFSPWLVGERDELLRSLFDELASAAIKIDPVADGASDSNATRWSEKERFKKALGPKLKNFGNLAGALGKFTRTAEALGVPLAGIASTVLERGGELAQTVVAEEPTSKRKADLVEELAKLSRAIVVFIDDLDRLEPREVSEVLRLIRAVADFPNIIYVLSYDPEIVAGTIARALQVEDGGAFLEKIVQVSFRVPRPEAFDLRRWFQAEVKQLFATQLESIVNPDVSERLMHVIDDQGGRYIETGRDVARAINALRLHAVPIMERIDVADMVWLQLIKIGNPQFYGWIEQYLTELAALSGAPNVSISRETRLAMARRLDAIIAAENLDRDFAYITLSLVLPGISPEEGGLFKNVDATHVAAFVTANRLGSPEHYRLYFAFSQPAGSLRDEQIELFIQAAKASPQEAALMFNKLSRETRPQGGSLAELLMDRLLMSIDRLPNEAIPAIVHALGETMDCDELAIAGDFNERFAWHAATRLLKRLLKKAQPETRSLAVDPLFREGKALGWLSLVLREEIFSHGIYGNRARPESDWVLDPAEFDSAVRIMNNRYSQLDSETMTKVPDFLNLLFAWDQSGHPNEARAWVEAQTATTRGLLVFLCKTKSWLNRNGKTFYPLRRQNLEHFLDFDATLQRLEEISHQSGESDQALAKELLATVDDDERRR